MGFLFVFIRIRSKNRARVENEKMDTEVKLGFWEEYID